MMHRFAGVGMAIVLCACNPQPQRNAAEPTPSLAAGVPALEVHGHGTSREPTSFSDQKGNRRLYQLFAKSYTSRSAQNLAQATFQQATVTFYDKDGSSMTARAPQASLDQRSKEIALSGGVQATTSSGATLTCQRLVYNRATERITGTGNVRMTLRQNGTAETFTGNQFTSNVTLTQMVLK